jgi:acetaldehyde dehydrogenase/alcohol dehydrogenase
VEAFLDYADEVVGKARTAGTALGRQDQEQTDRIVREIFRAAFAARVELARMASDETGIGYFPHKVLKNAWASLLVYEDIIYRRTVGVLGENHRKGMMDVAHPKGPVLALTPVTNPTSTVIFKCLLAAKTRNPIIFSPHGGARKSSREAAKICYEAALAAGAPEHCIQWTTKRHKDALSALMSHRRLGLILATGTQDVVKWAQRSGNPVIGSGPGNVPVYIHPDADLELAARSVVHSKTFDNGTVCASEQSLIVTGEIDEQMRGFLEARGSYFCKPAEVQALEQVAFDKERRGMAVGVVGRPAADIAQMAGFSVPDGTRLLVAGQTSVGRDDPLSHEILAPILAYYVVDSVEEAMQLAADVSHRGGEGHSLSVWTEDRALVVEFAARVPAGRVLVNQPATDGAIGGIYNQLPASLTLGTGSGGGNLTTDNITIEHLLTIQRVVRRRENGRWLRIPQEMFLDENADPDELHARYNRMW